MPRDERRTFAVRTQLAARVGAPPDLGVRGWRGNGEEQNAMALVLGSEITLRSLMLAAERRRRKDRKVLQSALKDAPRVERTWTFLAHALLTRLGLKNDLALLQRFHPLGEPEAALLASASDRAKAGEIVSAEVGWTFDAFSLLTERETSESLARFSAGPSDPELGAWLDRWWDTAASVWFEGGPFAPPPS